MLTIPEIRDRLIEIARSGEIECHIAEEIEALAWATLRRRGKRSPVRSDPVTPEVIYGVQMMHAAQPKLHLSKIAHHFNINPGRVSEILRGKRV